MCSHYRILLPTLAMLLPAACTETRLPSASGCTYRGKHYNAHQEFTEDCNVCTCRHDGTVSCSLIDCNQLKKSCTYKGKVYQDQQEFKDDCNSCKCNPQGSVGVSCTQKACQKCPTQPAYGQSCNAAMLPEVCTYSRDCDPSLPPEFYIITDCRCQSGKWQCLPSGSCPQHHDAAAPPKPDAGPADANVGCPNDPPEAGKACASTDTCYYPVDQGGPEPSTLYCRCPSGVWQCKKLGPYRPDAFVSDAGADS
jgi:hypothetical protein